MDDDFFEIKVETQVKLEPGEPDDHTLVFCLKLLNIDDDGNEDEVGRLYLLKVDVERGTSNQYTLYDLLDSHSSDAEFFAEAILDHDTEDFSKAFLESLELSHVAKILIVHVCAIMPDKRGKSLGLKFVARGIEMLGDDCELILCLPKPIDSAEISNGELPEEWLHQNGPGQEGLCGYWSKLGLTRVADTAVYAKNNQFL